MSFKSFYFAGGGTGGHIYPALAVAEKIAELEPQAKVHFFVSGRDIDSQILSKTNFTYTVLPAVGLTLNPKGFINFISLFFKSCRIARDVLSKVDNPVVIGAGGFIAAPVCRAGHTLKIPVKLLNVDIVPGRANKLAARWADEVFIQFEETKKYFAQKDLKVTVTGCPLRSAFDNPDPDKAIDELGLERDKKILLITGASSGSQSINETICSLLHKLADFSEDWQIVHLTGENNFEDVKTRYTDSKINSKILDYYDDMPNLLSAADLVIGRSGAVSVAEYAAANVPSICLPYPYHKDKHQYLNAEKLVKAGAAVVVDDLPDAKERAEWLWEELEHLLKDEEARQKMTESCRITATTQAVHDIAEILLSIYITR
ncbi:MAG: UDP-N-acetylglucosamine--N-acetylmuramyl-(pentapeptide) pyrophosphoryl-undecaprenol N-acetylglucosamine transferase [Planctomycetota bacterium]|jgi:UDP-N-acetylglucosamine--N-acetylmuramyl-(pentapeptide) pyrophosphoryl-undecaprenol N-acetylglucosamine transferase